MGGSCSIKTAISGAPWGLNIDGNDDVWVANFKAGEVVLMAGDETKGHPADTKSGDVIHVFTSGSIQMLTDVAIDPAGDVWAANNWNNLDAVAAEKPAISRYGDPERIRPWRH
jgi:hypothetical protein